MLPCAKPRVLTEIQTHEVIGSPPNVSVPTHFAKVVLTSKPSSPSTPSIPDLALGAFVLPNAVIKDEAPLEGFVVPGMLHSTSVFKLRFVTPLFFQWRLLKKLPG
jgi:DNA/RNA endonuclease G (NUC1)